MDLKHYKASAERTDDDERALIPAFKRTKPDNYERAHAKAINQIRVKLFHTRIDACDTLLDYLHDDVPWKDQQPMADILKQLRRDFEDQLTEGIQSCHE